MKHVGIIQGRLSPPVDNQIQAFPRETWRSEFTNCLHNVGLSHIEWIITEECFRDNPLMVDSEETRKVLSWNSHMIGTICCDHLINSRVGYADNVGEFLEQNLTPVCERVSKIGHHPRFGFNTIGIPLLDASSMECTGKSLDTFKREIVKITDRFPNLLFSFEAELDHERLLSLVDLRPNYRVTYDTGNITSYSNNHKEYLPAVFDKIDNVHLKDRLYDYTVGAWKTVWPGTGRTDFNFIFGMLKTLGYDGSYTLQLARGLDGLEQKTVEYQKYHMQALYERAPQQGTK